MNIKFYLGKAGGSLYVQKESGDPRAKASGYTRDVHGWGAEIHLLGLILKRCEQFGLKLARVKMSADGHLMGDEHMSYLRTHKRSERDQPNMLAYHGSYAVESSAEQYNNGEEVRFDIQGDIFSTQDPQPNWWRLLHRICEAGGIECELSARVQSELEGVTI